jgi:hypothetical protein
MIKNIYVIPRADIYEYLVKKVRLEMKQRMDKRSKECYKKELQLLHEIQNI